MDNAPHAKSSKEPQESPTSPLPSNTGPDRALRAEGPAPPRDGRGHEEDTALRGEAGGASVSPRTSQKAESSAAGPAVSHKRKRGEISPRRPLLLFDFDETLGVWGGTKKGRKQIKWRPGARKVIQRAKEAGFDVGVWTNAKVEPKIAALKSTNLFGDHLYTGKDGEGKVPGKPHHKMKNISRKFPGRKDVWIVDNDKVKIPAEDREAHLISITTWDGQCTSKTPLKQALKDVKQRRAELLGASDGNAEKKRRSAPAPSVGNARVPPGMEHALKSVTAGLPSTSVVLFELNNEQEAKSLNELSMLPEHEMTIASLLAAIKEGSGGEFRRVIYSPSECFEDGRLYSDEVSMQTIKRWMRNRIMYEDHFDIDMACAAQTLFWQEYQRAFPKGLSRQSSSALEHVKTFAADRSGYFATIREAEPKLRDLKDKTLKKVFLTCFHGGDHEWHLGFHSKALARWEADISILLTDLTHHADFKSTWKRIQDDDSRTHKLGSFAACVWQKPENQCLMALLDFLQKELYRISSLEFDGLKPRRKKGQAYPTPFPVTVLRLAEAYILRKAGYRIVLVEKDMTPTADEIALYYGKKVISKIKTATGQPDFRAQMCYRIVRQAQLMNAIRRDGSVWVPHTTIPGVYKREQDAGDFIRKATNGARGRTSVVSKTLLDFFNTADDPRAPIVTNLEREIISFLDGFWNIDTDTFTSWADHKEKPPPLTDMYYEVNFPHSKQATPLWRKLVDSQLDEVTGEMLEVLMGRLFYPVGHKDNWEILPILQGDAGTGKSSVINVVKSAFPEGQVGVYSKNSETTFGNQSLYTKRLVTCPDIPEGFEKVLDGSSMQSMVSGDPVNVPGKNIVATNLPAWKVQMLMACNPNNFPKWPDNAGSVSRRIALFVYTNLLEERDTTLVSRLKETELPYVVINWVRSYLAKVKEVGDKSFWEFAPETLNASREEVKEAQNYLADFISNGSDFYQCRYQKGAITTLDALSKAYSNFMRITHKQEKATLGRDYQVIKAAGYKVEVQNLCKTCHKKCTVEECNENATVPHYDAKNRYKKVVVDGMKLDKRDEYGNWPGCSSLEDGLPRRDYGNDKHDNKYYNKY